MNVLAIAAALLTLVVVVESTKKCWGVCGRGHSLRGVNGREMDGDVGQVGGGETPLFRHEVRQPREHDHVFDAIFSGIMVRLCERMFYLRVRVRASI